MVNLTAVGLVVTGAFGILPPRNAPTTTKYRIESTTETTVDLSGLGQPSQQVNIGLVSWIGVTLTDTAGGRVLQVIVDSIRYQGTTPQVTEATADSARGATMHGLVEHQGHLKDLTSVPADNAFLSDVQGVLHSFFPKLRLDAKDGEGWSDTVEVTNTNNGSNIKSRFFIDYTASGREVVAGVAALKLTASSKATISGTTENPMAGTMEVSGTVSGTSESLIGPDGTYLGGSSSSTSDQQIKMAMAPAPIPVKTTRTVRVMVVK